MGCACVNVSLLLFRPAHPAMEQELAAVLEVDEMQQQMQRAEAERLAELRKKARMDVIDLLVSSLTAGSYNASTVRIAYKVGGYSNILDIVINFSNSFSFAITKYTQLSPIVIIVYSNISPIVIKFLFQKTFITLFLHRYID